MDITRCPFVCLAPQLWREELEDEPGTHADFGAEMVCNRTYEWNHTLGGVVSAEIEAGLHLQFLHDYTIFPRWPFLEKSGFDTYRLPEGTPKLLLMYSLRACKSD